MRSRMPLFALLLVAGSLALPFVVHAGIPFFGPIVPEATRQCALGWGALIDVINRIIELLITLAIVFVAPLMIAWAGFLYVVNPVDPSGISKARGILLHTIIGIVIALAAWMIVDAIMLALYEPNTPINGNGGKLGAWSDLIGSRGALPCIEQSGSVKPAVAPTPSVGVAGAGRFINNVGAQVRDESGPLRTLLSCMSGKLTSNETITSISDNKIASNVESFSSCRTNGKPTCAHTANSCHYGGRRCEDASYAVDIAGNASDIITAAQACGASTLNESNPPHVHVSIGSQSGCGCDTRLD